MAPFLNQLSAAASSPLGLAAYALVLAAWLLRAWQVQKPQRESRRILEQFKDDEERNRALGALIGTEPPRGLAQADILEWVRLQSKAGARTYLLIAYLATLAAVMVLLASALFAPKPAAAGNIRIHFRGPLQDCFPLPVSTLTVRIPRQPDLTLAAAGCDVEIPWKAGWKESDTAILSLSGGMNAALADASAKYPLKDRQWTVEVRAGAGAPRLLIQLFDYAGARERPERREMFDQFCEIVRNKISMLSEAMVSRNKACAYVAEIKVVRQRRELDLSPRDSLEHWRKTHSLQMLSGLLLETGGVSAVRSQPFFGDLVGAGASHIQLEMKIDANEFGRTVDTHSLAVLYALAMDARAMGRPDDVVFTYLAEAVSIARGLDSSIPGIAPLKDALRGAFTQANRPVPAEL
jgi:hypothetical protein